MALGEVLLMASGLLVVAVALALLARRVRVPVTVVLVVVGFAGGALADAVEVDRPLRGEGFEQVVILGFLPVLIFEAALGLSVRSFARNLLPILALAVPALVVSATIVALGLHVGLGTGMAVALLFGALISATDPVAVVAIFRDLGVPERLLTIVEGESLLNDGVTVVLFGILLTAALGGDTDFAAGILEFFKVFFGGAAIGAVIGLATAALLPRLDRLLAATLSVAVAYGAFVLSEEVFGLSGIMAGVAAGLVLAALAPSRASQEVRDLWEDLWGSLGFVANALLFLLIGLVIEPSLLADNLGPIALAIGLVLVARVIVVPPAVLALERLAHIPRVGVRNEVIIIWGGLRGGVALALALALPPELPERDMLVAMTGAVVLATLLLNATTIERLIRRLGLGRPDAAERFLSAAARISGASAARTRLEELGLEEPAVMGALEESEQRAREELERLELSRHEEEQVIARRGLVVERETYARLRDSGLLPPEAARVVIAEVEDAIEESKLRSVPLGRIERHRPGRLERLGAELARHLPTPPTPDPEEIELAEATARRLAAQRGREALDLFSRLPSVDQDALGAAREAFSRAESDAADALRRLDERLGEAADKLRRRQAEAISRFAATDALRDLAEAGVLPPRTVPDTPLPPSSPAVSR